jgi:hypothetical protein
MRPVAVMRGSAEPSRLMSGEDPSQKIRDYPCEGAGAKCQHCVWQSIRRDLGSQPLPERVHVTLTPNEVLSGRRDLIVKRVSLTHQTRRIGKGS